MMPGAERLGLHDNVWRRPMLRRSVLRHWRPATGARLNLGCGFDYKPGWTNLDYLNPSADVKHNLLQFPWPFPDNSYDWIFADQVLEHMPPTNVAGEDYLVLALKEIQRILRPGGRAYVGVPYGGSKADFAQLTHYRHFVKNSFNFLQNGTAAPSVLRQPGVLDQLMLVYRHVIRGVPFVTLPFNWGKAEEIVFIFEKKPTAPL